MPAAPPKELQIQSVESVGHCTSGKVGGEDNNHRLISEKL